MKTVNCRRKAFDRRCPAVWLSMIAASALSPIGASAIEIDTGNPDVTVTFNNTVRYTYMRRMQDIDPHVAFAGPAPGYSYALGDYSVKKGGSISNRIEDLVELNFSYKENYGFRVTGSLWYDHAFKDKKPTALPGQVPLGNPYQGGEYSHTVKRYYEGPSAEFLDAYVFGNFATDVADINVRVGRHANVWGEGLVGSNHSIAYSQGPSDARKQTTSPGASAKETALPINQLSFSSVFSPEWTALGYYQFEWRASRVPEGGTYFAGADVILEGPINNRLEPKKGESGAWGLGLKWSPHWLDGTLGFYYRRFDDMNAGWAAQLAAPPVTSQAVYAKDIELYGVSLSKTIAGVSVGAEVSHRKDAPLTSNPGAAAPGPIPEGARGDTWHALVNGIKIFNTSPFYDSATLVGEVAWSKLDKLTRNGNLYRASGYTATCTTPALGGPAGGSPDIRGCVKSDFYQATVIYTPSWLQVFPGIDLTAPLLFQKNFGNAATAGGGSDGFVTYKVGVTATAYVKHSFDLSYTWWDQNIDRAKPGMAGPIAGGAFLGAGGTIYGRVQGAPYADKGFLAFTYQTTF